MWGSRPDPDAVARSTGMSALEFSVRKDCTLADTRSSSALFVGPRLEPPDAIGSYPAGPAADGREWKYPAEVNGWPIRLDPLIFPPGCWINSPFAWRGNITCARPVTTSG